MSLKRESLPHLPSRRSGLMIPVLYKLHLYDALMKNDYKRTCPSDFQVHEVGRPVKTRCSSDAVLKSATDSSNSIDSTLMTPPSFELVTSR